RREITGGGRVKRPDYLGPPDCPNCSERSKEHNSYYERPRYARDAPQVLEEGETRDGERREGRREEGAGRKETDARRARGKGQAGGTGGQEGGSKEGGGQEARGPEARDESTSASAATGRGRSGGERGPCRDRGDRPDRSPDPDRVRETRGLLPRRRRGRIPRGFPIHAASSRHSRTRRLAGLPR